MTLPLIEEKDGRCRKKVDRLMDLGGPLHIHLS
jgi:hypothetical protein